MPFFQQISGWWATFFVLISYATLYRRLAGVRGGRLMLVSVGNTLLPPVVSVRLPTNCGDLQFAHAGLLPSSVLQDYSRPNEVVIPNLTRLVVYEDNLQAEAKPFGDDRNAPIAQGIWG